MAILRVIGMFYLTIRGGKNQEKVCYFTYFYDVAKGCTADKKIGGAVFFRQHLDQSYLIICKLPQRWQVHPTQFW